MSVRKAAASDGPYSLPEGWRWVTLGEVAEINPKGAKPADDDDVSFVGMAQLDADTATATPLETRSFAEVSSGYTVFRNRDILAAKITPCWENGKVGQAELDHEVGVGSTEFHVIRPGNELHTRYALHFLRLPDVRATGELRMTGSAGQRRVPTKYFTDLQIPLPPLSEQRWIAEILDGVSTAIEAATLSIDSLADLASREYNIRFGQDPMVSFVEDISEEGKNRIRTGPFGSQLKKEEYSHSGISVLGLDNVVGNEFSWGKRRYIPEEKYESLKRYTVRPGDVLISIMATTGRCVVVPEGIPTSINTKHICAITVDQEKVIPEFLRATFLWNPSARSYLNRQTKGAIMSGLNMSIVKNMPVPVPSIGRQEEFVKFCRRIDIVAGYLKSRYSFLGELLNSLQSRAFRGEL
ncbi:MAG: restriction endonuclease subunit S [Bifidobacterium crudilactis]|nr:restriction endonuclease subunit S [Bifidobacterium crudilactis]